jgi:hypothetical protein
MLLILSPNILLGWKSLPGTNTLAYLMPSHVSKKSTFYNIDTWSQCYETFFPSSLMMRPNKLEGCPWKPFPVRSLNLWARPEQTQWKGINRKHSTRWQHLSRLKARAFFSLQKIFIVMKYSNLYLVLVLPSGG